LDRNRPAIRKRETYDVPNNDTHSTFKKIAATSHIEMEEIAATPHVEMEEIAATLQHPRRQPKTEWPNGNRSLSGVPPNIQRDRDKSEHFLDKFNELTKSSMEMPANLTIPYLKVALCLSYFNGPKVDAWARQHPSMAETTPTNKTASQYGQIPYGSFSSVCFSHRRCCLASVYFGPLK